VEHELALEKVVLEGIELARGDTGSEINPTIESVTSRGWWHAWGGQRTGQGRRGKFRVRRRCVRMWEGCLCVVWPCGPTKAGLRDSAS
jgi:hypothetical protein